MLAALDFEEIMNGTKLSYAPELGYEKSLLIALLSCHV